MLTTGLQATFSLSQGGGGCFDRYYMLFKTYRLGATSQILADSVESCLLHWEAEPSSVLFSAFRAGFCLLPRQDEFLSILASYLRHIF